jgi:hypothetical protein
VHQPETESLVQKSVLILKRLFQMEILLRLRTSPGQLPANSNAKSFTMYVHERIRHLPLILFDADFGLVVLLELVRPRAVHALVGGKVEVAFRA